jgi:hypothetical protein
MLRHFTSRKLARTAVLIAFASMRVSADDSGAVLSADEALAYQYQRAQSECAMTDAQRAAAQSEHGTACASSEIWSLAVDPICARDALSGGALCSSVSLADCETKSRVLLDGTRKPCVVSGSSCATGGDKTDCSEDDSTYDNRGTNAGDKRGLCLGASMYSDNRWASADAQTTIMGELGPKWLCSFGVSANVAAFAKTAVVPYVPQLWGKNALTDNLQEFKDWVTNQECSSTDKCLVLTFNEPTLSNQAEMAYPTNTDPERFDYWSNAQYQYPDAADFEAAVELWKTEVKTAWKSIVQTLKAPEHEDNSGVALFDKVELATPCQASANAVEDWLKPFLALIDADSDTDSDTDSDADRTYAYHCVHRYVDGGTNPTTATENVATWLDAVKGNLPEGDTLPLIVKEYGWKSGPENCEGECMLKFQQKVQTLFEADERVKLYAQFTPDPDPDPGKTDYSVNFGQASRLINVNRVGKLYVTNFGQHYRTLIVGDNTVGTSDLFANGVNTVNWPRVITLTTAAEGDASQGDQILEIFITSLPSEGAQFRLIETMDNNQWNFRGAETLVLGSNTIGDYSVDYNRAVKIQFSSGDVAFSEIKINGNTIYS